MEDINIEEFFTEAKSLPAFDEEGLKRFVAVESMAKKWIILGSPMPTMIVLSLYGLIVLIGPKIMEKREPYKIKTILRFYNLLQVAHNSYILFGMYIHPDALYNAIVRSCSELTYDEYIQKVHTDFLLYSWQFLVSKQLDLLDTVFMVLRKKNSHITFLHVYHHFAMVFFPWLTLHNSRPLHAIVPGLINVIIHMIMYSYYFLATFNRLQRLLWWKKYLTMLQLGQFAIILLYIGGVYYFGCPISSSFTFTWTFNVFVIMLLFVNFYIKTYVQKSKQTTKEPPKNKKEKSL